MKGSRKTKAVLQILQNLKTSHEEMEEMLKSRRHKKLTKKLPQTSSPANGTNFEEVFIEKIEQRN